MEQFPQEGGSYTRDPETGTLSRVAEPVAPKPAEKEPTK